MTQTYIILLQGGIILKIRKEKVKLMDLQKVDRKKRQSEILHFFLIIMIMHVR